MKDNNKDTECLACAKDMALYFLFENILISSPNLLKNKEKFIKESNPLPYNTL